MFTEIAEQVFELGASKPGPAIAIVGGIHGNELTGIEVVKGLKKDFESGVLKLISGTLLLAFGNPKAIALGERGSEPYADLNRCFTSQVFCGPKQQYEEKRAFKLAIALRTAYGVIDIHATNKPSEPFVVCQAKPDVRHKNIYRWLGARHIITDPRWIFAGKPVTLDEYIARDGGVGICYETGEDKDTSRVKEVQKEIENVLAGLGLLAPTSRLVPPRRIREIYALTQSIILWNEDSFSYEQGMGLYNFQPVKIGETIGNFKNERLIAKKDSVLIFPKIKSLWKVGEPVGYLAERI